MPDPFLVDIGVNLTHKSFASDLQAVLQRARDAGVGQLVLTGTSLEGSQRARELCAEAPEMLFATAGVHPHHASEGDDATLGALRELCSHPEVVAVGECGLDFNRDFSPRPVQEVFFERQLELAAELQLPVFLHERDAHERFSAILRAHLPTLPAAVVHCFTGSREALEDYLELGCSIGITGWICDERRGLGLRELVPLIPPDRLLLETDAPFLMPRTLSPRPRSRRNEPAFLPEVLRMVAECAGRAPAEVAQQTTENASRFFGIPQH